MALCLVHNVLKQCASSTSFTLGCGRRRRPEPQPATSGGVALAIGSACLPEALQAHIISFGGAQAHLNTSLTSRRSAAELWENPRLWLELLPAGEGRAQLSAAELRDEYRWAHCGISLLASGKLTSLDRCSDALAKAESAIRALLPRDAAHAARIGEAVANLLRTIGSSGMPLPSERNVKAVVSAAAAQTEIFTLDQTLAIVSAHHACIRWVQPTKSEPRKPRLSRAPTQRTPTCSRVQRQDSVQDEMMGRLSFMLQDCAAEIATPVACVG